MIISKINWSYNRIDIKAICHSTMLTINSTLVLADKSLLFCVYTVYTWNHSSMAGLMTDWHTLFCPMLLMHSALCMKSAQFTWRLHLSNRAISSGRLGCGIRSTSSPAASDLNKTLFQWPRPYIKVAMWHMLKWLVAKKNRQNYTFNYFVHTLHSPISCSLTVQYNLSATYCVRIYFIHTSHV